MSPSHDPDATGPVESLNRLAEDKALERFRRCCGAAWWCARMAERRPFANAERLHREADRQFDAMPREAWLEAFTHHPRLGDLESLKMRFSGNKQWSLGEQAGVAVADEQTLARLRDGNNKYADRFGYTFLLCATGKSAAEMLAALEARLTNAPEDELAVAAAEQRRISHLRIDKLLAELVATPDPEDKATP